MEERLVFSQRAGGGYVAVLSEGCCYDGSRVIRADSEEEVRAKAELAERLDDLRWVTLNHSHVLIEDKTGEIVGGAGGRLNGKRYGYRFTYEKGEKEPFMGRGLSARRRRVAHNKYHTQSKQAADRRFRPRAAKAWQRAGKRTREALYSYVNGGAVGPDGLLQDAKVLYMSSSDLAESVKKIPLWQKRLNNAKAIERAVRQCKLKGGAVTSRKMDFRKAAKFLGVTPDFLKSATEADLKRELIGTTHTEHSFCDTTLSRPLLSAKDVSFEIYVPKGAEAMYLEPIAPYQSGKGGGLGWDGKTKQKGLGGQRLLLQRGTKQGVRDIVKRPNGGVVVYVDVTGYEQLYLPKRLEEKEK